MEEHYHLDPDTALKWAAFLGRWRKEMNEKDCLPNFIIDQIISLAEHYPDYTCYRIKQAHCKITGYTPSGTYSNPAFTVNVLQGRNSKFPGMMMTGVPAIELIRCDCGEWMPPTKKDTQKAEQRYQRAVVQAKRALN